MEWASGNIFIRPMEFAKAGEINPGHKHNFDHTTIVFTGSVHVAATLPDGSVKEGDFTAPSYFLVRKDVLHEIKATSDNTVCWCVYSHRTPQGDVVQVFDGWQEAMA